MNCSTRLEYYASDLNEKYGYIMKYHIPQNVLIEKTLEEIKFFFDYLRTLYIYNPELRYFFLDPRLDLNQAADFCINAIYILDQFLQRYHYKINRKRKRGDEYEE